jgi:hypothetical protein
LLCPNCQSEQGRNKFCNQCGTRLKEEKDQEEINMLSTPSHENSTAKFQKVVKPPNGLSVFTQFLNKPTLIKGISFVISAQIVIFLLSFIFKMTLDDSRLIKDHLYLLLTTTLQLSEQIAMQLLTEMKVSLFDVLITIHGGTLEGKVFFKNIPDPQADFSLQFPFLLAMFMIVFVLALMFKYFKRFIGDNALQKITCLVMIAIAYGIILVIILNWLEPTYMTNSVLFKESFSGMALFINSLIMVLLAGIIGLGPWKKTEELQPLRWIVLLKPIKSVFVTLFILEGFILVLMVLTWMLADPAVLMAQPISTPGSMWYTYRDDPLFYILLPNIVIADQLYALGSTWQISTPLLGEFVQLNYPLSINLLSGVTAPVPMEMNQWLKQVDAARFVWHPFALLLAFLYSLSRLKLTRDIKQLAWQGIAIVSILALLAKWVTISISDHVRNADGIAGFSITQVFLTTAIVVAIFYLAYFQIQKRVLKQRLGDKS